MIGCDACRPARPGFIRVIKGNREVWGPCICNASHIDKPCDSCPLCEKRRAESQVMGNHFKENYLTPPPGVKELLDNHKEISS